MIVNKLLACAADQLTTLCLVDFNEAEKFGAKRALMQEMEKEVGALFGLCAL